MEEDQDLGRVWDVQRKLKKDSKEVKDAGGRFLNIEVEILSGPGADVLEKFSAFFNSWRENGRLYFWVLED